MTTLREQPEDELLTIAEIAALLKCKVTSIYTLTRKRAQLRHANPIPVVRLPCGLRFRKSSVLAWIIAQEKRGSL
jgi:predicted DNA-binding transcriptional regulator AlpA